ncbi:Xaa-Pro peptidase family protein [Spelaeicoccus albus]
MARAGLDAMLITPGSDLFYLTGYAALPLERLTCLVLTDGAAALVVPTLERPAAEEAVDDALGLDIVDLGETDDVASRIRSLLDGRMSRVAVDDHMWASRVLWLQDDVGVGRVRLAGEVLAPLREIKDDYELGELRRAGEAIDRVHARVPEMLTAGRTEVEVSAAISAAIVDAGHARTDFAIVAAGPNGASPHHEPGSRVLRDGDAVVVDIGGTLPSGYASDCTRTYVVGHADPELQRMYDVLYRSQAAARDHARPGVTCASVDAAARDVIEQAGYGEFFTHRTGHGIGLETHEDPYIVDGNERRVEPGMAFSIEPGIYLPGLFGARIEDIMITLPSGCQPVNNQPRTLR